ncbi:MAG: hypothetical protein HY658_02685 [Actinobacteria bacterium]|nr:hypothetical protein [Actinomycetota bacterium]
MCRALLVLCVAPDRPALLALQRAAAGAGWELAGGATSVEEAVELLRGRKPHVLVAFGTMGTDLLERARAERPGIRVVSVGPLPGADAQVASLEGVGEAILGMPPPAGPVRT